MSRQDDLRALDPGLSVVVEACAGSGKTWTLVSRLIRLLLAGAQPGEILAITYTRKAAREIEERLQHWLSELAVADDARVAAFLAERGLDVQRDPALLDRARGLFEQVASARPGLTVNTFHGWFSSLLGAAPLNSGLRGLQLSERTAQLREQAWAALMRRAGRAPDSELAVAVRYLLAQCGVAGTQKLAGALIDRRAEWQAWLAAHGDLSGVLAYLQHFFGADAEAPVDVLGQDEPLRHRCLDFARLLGQGTEAQQRKATAIEQACAQVDAQEYFVGLRVEMLKLDGQAIAFKPGKALEKAGAADAALVLFEQIVARLQQCLNALSDRAAWALNAPGLQVSAALLEAYDRIKLNAGVLDFGDLEWHASRLLADAQTGPFVQARLDARYRHLLLDEFQDTNPLQWQVLMHWLDAYAPGQVQPVVFVVGDPKQSIYRFRRADPRIFAHAAEVFAQRFGAVRLQRNETRRNSPAVVAAVNAVFGAFDVFEGFAPHSTTQIDLPGRVEVLPAFGHEAVAASPADVPDAGLRNPLFEARLTVEDSRRQREAEAMCVRLKEMAGRLAVRDAHTGDTRPARYGDMMILLRRRTGLAVYEAALRAHGIPYFGASRGRLLDTLEASDLLALLRFLVAPADPLSLAHVLRSPLFAFSDDRLLDLTLGGAERMWSALRAQRDGRDAEHARAALLLSGWLEASARLPVHDLLDRVFDQGALMQRYAASIDPMAWPGVRANLEAFIELALQVDSGRFPSLPRFIDELTRLRNDDDEAPDEGLILGEDPSRGRVRVLTVHAAKGLEAPIVWLADAVARPRPDSGARVLLSWPPGEAAPGHLSLLQRKDNQGRARASFIDADARAAAREDANLLYVALTRARQVLCVSGVAPSRGTGDDSWLARLASALAGCAGAEATGEGGIRLDHGEIADCPADALPGRFAASSADAMPVALAVQAIGERHPPVMLDAAQLWGVGLHGWLEALGCGEPQPARPAGLDPTQWRELETIARRLVASEALRRFFDPAQHRWSANELEFVLPDGRIGRIDRLVEFDDDIWILDYKSGQGSRFADAYTEQLAGYAEAVALIRPGKTLHAALIRPDGQLDVRF